jgi:hypothetical protein
MIEKAQRRLRQAGFFYHHLVRERQQTSRADPEAFRFYFSAFIQAARSVTWTLGNEEPDKWEAWEPNWKANLSSEEQKLLDLTNERRIDEVHRGGADLTVELEEVAVQAAVDIRPPTSWERSGLSSFSAEIQIVTKKELRAAHYFEDKEGKEEITAFCERYLKFLEKTVDDFIRENS